MDRCDKDIYLQADCRAPIRFDVFDLPLRIFTDSIHCKMKTETVCLRSANVLTVTLQLCEQLMKELLGRCH